MPEENRLLNLHFENFIKSYSGLLKIDSRIDLTHFNTLCTDSRKINKNDIFQQKVTSDRKICKIFSIMQKI